MEDNKEYRNIAVELRKSDTGEVLGVALTTNQPYEVRSNKGNFYEQIAPSALQGLIEDNDIFAMINHNPDKILARSNKGQGSLKLSSDGNNLSYGFKLDSSPVHQELDGYLTRGDITASSFGFVVGDKNDKWEKRSDGQYLRTINKFSTVIDVSPVFNAANPNTVVSKRSVDMLEELRSKELLELDEQQAIEAVKDKEFEAYIKNFKKKNLPNFYK